MKIQVESIRVYAMINYLRDKVVIQDAELPVWKEVEEEYLDEAKHVKGYILTEEEIESIVSFVEKCEDRNK